MSGCINSASFFFVLKFSCNDVFKKGKDIKENVLLLEILFCIQGSNGTKNPIAYLLRRLDISVQFAEHTHVVLILFSVCQIFTLLLNRLWHEFN